MKSAKSSRPQREAGLSDLPALRFSSSTFEELRSVHLDQPFAAWTDESGVSIGRAALDGDICWIELDGVGVYRFRLQDGDVEAAPARRVGEGVVTDSFQRAILPHVLQVRGTQVLHASAVMFGDEVIGLCGTSGVGKSTLALGLARRGHRPWADDALIVQCRDSAVFTYPLPFRFRLQDRVVEEAHRSAAEGHDSITVWKGLRALVVVRRVENGQPGSLKWRRLERSMAFQALLPHAYWLAVGDTVRQRQMIETYLTLAAGVPVFEGVFVPDLRKLDHLVGELESHVREM